MFLVLSLGFGPRAKGLLGLAKGLRSAHEKIFKSRPGLEAPRARPKRLSPLSGEVRLKESDRTGTPGEDRPRERRAKPVTRGELRRRLTGLWFAALRLLWIVARARIHGGRKSA
jgi:hypothetical protein